MSARGSTLLDPSSSAEDVASAAGASDLFLFRRVEQRRFAHIGGVGRGAGWAGIVELGLDHEPVIAEALDSGEVRRHFRPDAWHVFGPYYGRAVAIVPVNDDVVAVFGSSEADMLDLSDDAFRELAFFASESVREVAAAKRLADELEVVNAIRDLLRLPGGTLAETFSGVIDHVREALSCELGVLYSRAPRLVAVSDPAGMLDIGEEELCRVMERIAERDVPLCVQDAQTSELPPPFSAADGVLAYYLLELEDPIGGAMLLLHTESAPRGFTLLCQSLGLRLIDAAGALFETARARDALRSELARTTEQARRDSLTGLANRLAWDEATAGASIPGAPTSIVQIDCRGLKFANETHGHDVGDRLLRRVSEIIAASVREHDLVARIGGDEFAVLLPDADEDVAADVIARIQALLVDEPPIETVVPQVAIGAATTRDGNLPAAQKNADTRMREAKRPTPLRSA